MRTLRATILNWKGDKDLSSNIITKIDNLTTSTDRLYNTLNGTLSANLDTIKNQILKLNGYLNQALEKGADVITQKSKAEVEALISSLQNLHTKLSATPTTIS